MCERTTVNFSAHNEQVVNVVSLLKPKLTNNNISSIIWVPSVYKKAEAGFFLRLKIFWCIHSALVFPADGIWIPKLVVNEERQVQHACHQGLFKEQNRCGFFFTEIGETFC